MNASHTLYRMFDDKGRLLYVGITAQPPARFRNHQEVKYWWESVAEIKLQNFDSREELEAAERAAIIDEVPFYNVTHNNKRWDTSRSQDGKPRREMVFTIAEVVMKTEMHKLSANPEQWITRKLVAGKFRGRKIGRQWAMTDADIEYMLDQLANTVAAPAPTAADPQQPAVGVPSLASMRRRRSA